MGQQESGYMNQNIRTRANGKVTPLINVLIIVIITKTKIVDWELDNTKNIYYLMKENKK